MQLDNCRVYRVETTAQGEQQTARVSLIHDADGAGACQIELVFLKSADAEQFPLGRRVSISID